jgi:hypothetical protein
MEDVIRWKLDTKSEDNHDAAVRLEKAFQRWAHEEL